MNQITIKGRLTSAPEVFTKEHVISCHFSVAVNRAKEKTDFFNCVAFNETARLIEKYFFKGKEIIVIGRMESETKDNKTYWTIKVKEFYFTGKKED